MDTISSRNPASLGGNQSPAGHKVRERRVIENNEIKRVVVSRLPTRYGLFDIYGYQAGRGGSAPAAMDQVALVFGQLPLPSPTLVRIHSECLTGEVFGSLRCDCQAQLELGLETIVANGSGVVVYMRGHEGRGIGLINKLRAYALQDHGANTVAANVDLGLPVDARDYSAAVAILRDLGISALRLMTNNPEKVRAVEQGGLVVAERVPLVTLSTTDNSDYIRTKQDELGHLFEPRS
jgi:3,4-dihydroxy 2-butanone 4-phosphate synthase/GTP cyclohydrolase II